MTSLSPLPAQIAFPREVLHISPPPPIRRKRASAVQEAPPYPRRRGRQVLPPVAPPPSPTLEDWITGGSWLPTVLHSRAKHIAHYILRAAPLNMVFEYVQNKIKTREESQEDIAAAYLFLLIGCIIFIDRSTNRVKHKYREFVLNHNKTGKFAWATGVLALLYPILGEAS
ncbi:hypothetical protein V2J09_021302 [Rumex salicifolius]